MPFLPQPPYQDPQNTLRWSNWYRQINTLLQDISVSIGNIDDITITAATDNDILQWDAGTSLWENEENWVIPGTLDAEGAVEMASTLDVVGVVGVGIEAASADATLHVNTATAGVVSAAAAADDLVVENSADAGISILCPADKDARLAFGSPTDSSSAILIWDATAAQFKVTTAIVGGDLMLGSGNSTNRLLINSAGDVGLGETTTPLAKLHVKDSAALSTYLESTNSGSGTGPALRLWRNSSTPADGDNGAGIQYRGNTDDGAGGVTTSDFQYAQIRAEHTETSDGNENSQLLFQTCTDGALTAKLRLDETTAKTINQVSGPTTAVTSASYTVLSTDRYLLCDTTSNAITVDLLAAGTAGSGARLDIKITNATNAVTIDGNGTETIDGALTLVLSTLYDNASLVCDGSNWHII